MPSDASRKRTPVRDHRNLPAQDAETLGDVARADPTRLKEKGATYEQA